VHIGLGCEYGVPDEVFMVIEPAPGCLADAAGIIR
jgi:predicted N-acetyltransferase YhbS